MLPAGFVFPISPVENYLDNEPFDGNTLRLTNSMDAHDSLFFDSRIPPRVLKGKRMDIFRWHRGNRAEMPRSASHCSIKIIVMSVPPRLCANPYN